MALPQSSAYMTPQEYYARERTADHKSEYFQGEIFAMAGTTTRHAKIGTSLLGELYSRLKGRHCSPYNSDQRIKVAATGLRTYPDASVFCSKMEYDPEDDQRETAVNPTMLFEVLSDSTEAFDRGTKSEQYRRIASLQAYVLINQGSAHVEHYERKDDGSWNFIEASGLDSTLPLPALGIKLPLGDLYAGAELDESSHLNVVRGR